MSSSGLAFAGDWLPVGPLAVPDAVRAYDLVCNLECIVGSPRVEAQKAYLSTAPPEALAWIEASQVRALNIANNHVYDYGDGVFGEMVARLRDVPHLQAYGTRDRPFAEFQFGDEQFAVVGCLEPCRSRGARLVREEDVTSILRDLDGTHAGVFVTPHWGKEGEYAFHPSPRQRRRAQEWVDQGARGVLGHHTHTFHGREHFGDAPVYYSLGNMVYEFEEGGAYPLTAFGLMVLWTPHTGTDHGAWREIFTKCEEGRLNQVDTDVQQHLAAFLEEISKPLGPGWDQDAWARRVGPIYVPKSNRSWKKRVRQSRLRTLALRAVWRLLPTTRALLRGCRSPDPDLHARVRELELALGLERAIEGS